MKLALVFSALALAVPMMACSGQLAEDGTASDESDVVGAQCERANPMPVICAEVYAPVCGCDGKTYGNACEANAYVTSHTPGACEAEDGGALQCKRANPVPVMCAEVYFPVCGCDGETYGNPCEADVYVTSHTPGACETEDGGALQCKRANPMPVACIEVYDPVCGCDGETYGNACVANIYVTSHSPGACE